jgi:hypothetical protein
VKRLGAVLVLALGAAACGGSDDPAQPGVTRAAWAGQARAICQRAEADSKRMAAEVQRERLSAVDEFDTLARRQGVLDARRMRRLRGLARPAADANRIDELLDRIAAADATLVPLARAIHSETLADGRDIDAKLVEMAPPLKRLAALLGVPECVPDQVKHA